MNTRFPRQRALAATLITAALAATVWLPTAHAATPTASGGAALDWLAKELDTNGHAMPSSFGGTDWGLTIDAILALAAGGRGGNASATAATSNAMSHVANEYFTGASFDSPNDRYAGALAKTLLVAKAQGINTGNIGGFDVEATLRERMRTTGDEAGRFSDKSDFGDFSNGLGQALAVLGLARTTNGIPSAAIAFLLDQQCANGGFRLLYAAADTDAAGCAADSQADTDATSLAMQALGAAPHTPATLTALDAAAAFVATRQASDGSVSGAGPTATPNANSTGLAAAAFRAAGRTNAANVAATWIESMQLTTANTSGSPAAPDAGAIAYDPAARDATIASGIAPEKRDQFRRATAQGALALGIDGYDKVGGHVFSTLTSQVTPSATTVAPGSSITVAATGFLTDESVTAILRSDPIVVGIKPASGGAVSFSVSLPASLAAGAHTIELTGEVSRVVGIATITVQSTDNAVVTATTTPATGGTTTTTRAASGLARSGADAQHEVELGVVLVLLGSAAVIGSRRRPRSLLR